jgi:hypothetical protein
VHVAKILFNLLMSLLDVEQTETVLTLLHVKTGNASILVHRETRVQEMLTVELSCINLYALAQMVILGIQELPVNYRQDPNARLIPNVQTTLHVSKKNVKILASQLLVESMLDAELLGIVLYVTVIQVMKEILIAFAKNLDVKAMMNVHLTKLASKENARTHVHLNNVASKLSVL